MAQFNANEFFLSINNCGYYYNPDPLSTTRTRIMAHYEIDFFDIDEGCLEINGIPMFFEPNTINLRIPGQTSHDIKSYHCLCVWFDIVKFDTVDENQKLLTYMEPHYKDCFLNQLPSKISVEGHDEIAKCMKKIIEYHGNIDENYSALMMNSYLNILLANLYEIYLGNNQNNKKYNLYVTKAIRFIELNFQYNIKINDIAEHVGLSTNYFQNIFKACTGSTPNDYLLNWRIKKAKQSLEQHAWPISDISDACGFSSTAYFSYVFKKHVGVTPSQFRGEFSNSI